MNFTLPITVFIFHWITTRCLLQRPLMNSIRKQSVSSGKGWLTPSTPTALQSNNNGNNNGDDHHNNDVPSRQLQFVCHRLVMEEAAVEEESSSHSPKSCFLCEKILKVYLGSRVSNICLTDATLESLKPHL